MAKRSRPYSLNPSSAAVLAPPVGHVCGLPAVYFTPIQVLEAAQKSFDPNHKDNWDLAQIAELASDEQLKTWLLEPTSSRPG